MGKISPSTRTTRLSPRQEQIRRLMLERMPAKQMAVVLGTSENSIKTQKKRMAVKLDKSVRELRGHFEASRMSGSETDSRVTPQLDGYWISRFRFSGYVRGSGSQGPKYHGGSQIDLEQIRSSAGFLTHAGYNLCGARTDSKSPYMHDLEIQAAGDNVMGFWRNRTSASAAGCFQLFVQKGGDAMEGSHLGMSANSVVQTGEWVWLRLAPEGADNIEPKLMRSFHDLDALFESGLDGRRALSVQDLFDLATLSHQ